MDRNFDEQLFSALTEDGDIFPNDDWKLEDYQKFFKYIKCGYIIQDSECYWFIKNPEYKNDD